MDYTVWVDAYGKKHDITDMPTSYIENCVNEIKRLLCTADGYTPGKYIDKHIFSIDWLARHGQSYLDTLEAELSRRK